MTAVKPKAYTWRVTDIPTGSSKQEVLSFFEFKYREKLTIGSLCAGVYSGSGMTATVLFRPDPENPDQSPQLEPLKPTDLDVDKDFEGFTPLYCPPNGTPIAAESVTHACSPQPRQFLTLH